MARRTTARITLITAMGLAACGSGPRSDPASLNTTRAALQAARSSDLSFVWLFETEDCLSCQAINVPVRRAEIRLERDIPIFAFHVGHPADSAYIKGFLRKNRLQAVVTHVVPNDANVLGIGDTPRLLMISRGAVVWADSLASGAVRLADFDSSLIRIRRGRSVSLEPQERMP